MLSEVSHPERFQVFDHAHRGLELDGARDVQTLAFHMDRIANYVFHHDEQVRVDLLQLRHWDAAGSLAAGGIRCGRVALNGHSLTAFMMRSSGLATSPSRKARARAPRAGKVSHSNADRATIRKLDRRSVDDTHFRPSWYDQSACHERAFRSETLAHDVQGHFRGAAHATQFNVAQPGRSNDEAAQSSLLSCRVAAERA